MSGKHTPGPWEFNDPAKFTQGWGKFSEVAVYAPGNAYQWRMCEVVGPDNETTIANARLIAAAPDLLGALDWLLASVTADPSAESYPGDRDERLALASGAARAAITKATGEAPR